MIESRGTGFSEPTPRGHAQMYRETSMYAPWAREVHRIVANRIGFRRDHVALLPPFIKDRSVTHPRATLIDPRAYTRLNHDS